MGSLGAGSFDNDEAGDWVLDLHDAVDLATVRGALAAALEATDYLETSEGGPAVAAAEVLAAAGGFPAGDLPEEVGAWVSAHTVAISSSDVTMALEALQAVESERSELQSLWSEEAIGATWRRNVDDLRDRLQRVAQAVDQGGAQIPGGRLLKRDRASAAGSSTMSAVVGEGEWHAVPLDGGGFARGLVARTSASEEFFLGYFFGPLIEVSPTLDSTTGLLPQDALVVGLVNDFQERPWRLLGRLPGWDRRQWPIPAFGRYFEFEAAPRDLRFDYVEDDLDSEPVGTWVPAEEVRQLPREGRMSTRGVETRLERLLRRPTG